MAIIRAGAASKASSTSAVRASRGQSVRSAEKSSYFDDSSDSEPPLDADSEVCQVGESVCSVPLELFDLADLKEVLSLETWNFSLTEEERESLVKLLPPMDEENYRLTLKQLFGGEAFHLSSPLTYLHELLKGGHCHPQAVRYQDVLRFLQRKEHHQNVREYHNHMVNYCLEMKSLWQHHSDVNLEEKMDTWNSWKLKKVLPPRSNFLQRKFRTPRVLALLERKAKFRPKELKKAVHLASNQPDNGFTLVAGERKLKRETISDSSGHGNAFGKIRGAGPKGVLKRLPNSSSKSQQLHTMVDRVEMTHVPVLEEVISSVSKVKASPSESERITTAAEALTPLTDKVNFRIKTDKKTKDLGYRKEQGLQKGSGIVSKHKKVKDAYEGVPKVMGREELAIAQELSLDEPMEDGLDFVDDAIIDVEEMQTSAYCLENQQMHEPNIGATRRKVKEKGFPDELHPSITRDDMYLVEERGLPVGMDSKDDGFDGSCEKPAKRRKKRLVSSENGSELHLSTPDGGEPSFDSIPRAKSSRKPAPSPVPPVASSFPFSVIHLLSSVRMALTADPCEQPSASHIENVISENVNSDGSFLLSHPTSFFPVNGQSLHSEDADAMKEQDDKRCGLPAVPLQVIVSRVHNNPGDPRILETQEPLQGLVRGVLKVLSAKTTQPVMKGWRPFVVYERESRGWLWIGPSPSSTNLETSGVQISAEAWAISQKMLYKIQEMFCNWLKHEQDILQQLGQLSFPAPPTTPILDEKERFRELRAQKSLITINPTSDEMRAYFRREETLRYSVPDRAFSYTSADGRKSAVAPLRRIGGKPTSKARDHFMLKPDRPPHVTILCLVRDAASRLPGSIGTRADVCALIRDSQYIVEDVSDAQLNQVVSGALDRLHYERDPCVRFDGDRKLWVYLHTDKDEEDFEDDATSSTKRWKRAKKEGLENLDIPFMQDYDYPGRDDQDACGLGLDFSPSSCLGDLYSSSGRAELVYTQSGSLASPHMIGAGYPNQGREDGVLPFIDLPPSIQPPCVNMQQSHPMGWEVLGNRWERDAHFQHNDHIVEDDYDAVAAMTASHQDTEILLDRGIP